MRALLALVSALAVAAGAASAQTPSEASAKAAEGLRAAIVALGEADGAKDRVAALTQTIGAYELGLSAFRDSLRGALVRERELTLALEARRDRVGQVLTALTSMQDVPGPLLLMHPDGPEAAVRSGLVLSAVAPALQAEVEALRADLTEIAAIRALREEAAGMLQDGLASAQEARTLLSQAMQDRTDLPRRYLDDPEELTALVANAKTLDAFSEGLRGMETDIGAPMADFASMRGALPLPVLGRIIRRAGESDAAGIRRPGLVIAAQPSALVTAPATATIRYSGPLLDYGNVMILEPADGYLMVIAGLGTVYGVAGDVLSEGAPVGLMPGSEGGTDPLLSEIQEPLGTDRTESLYLELRQGEEPVDPSGWFSDAKG